MAPVGRSVHSRRSTTACYACADVNVVNFQTKFINQCRAWDAWRRVGLRCPQCGWWALPSLTVNRTPGWDRQCLHRDPQARRGAENVWPAASEPDQSRFPDAIAARSNSSSMPGCSRRLPAKAGVWQRGRRRLLQQAPEPPLQTKRSRQARRLSWPAPSVRPPT